jgi:hypothetical protein
MALARTKWDGKLNIIAEHVMVNFAIFKRLSEELQYVLLKFLYFNQ